MSNIIVLGGGMVGSAMAIDLAKKHKVLLTDINQDVLASVKQKCSELDTMVLDVLDVKLLQHTITNFDLVVSAVPGFLGYQTLENIIKAEMNVVDISFFPENSLELDHLGFGLASAPVVNFCPANPWFLNTIATTQGSRW